MQSKDRREFLKAVLSGNKRQALKFTKVKVIFFKDELSYYKCNMDNPISKEQFEAEFQLGFDMLIEFADFSGQQEALKEFGLTEKELEEFAKNQTPHKETINNLLLLKNNLENE
jgi:hypothetical protein